MSDAELPPPGETNIDIPAPLSHTEFSTRELVDLHRQLGILGRYLNINGRPEYTHLAQTLAAAFAGEVLTRGGLDLLEPDSDYDVMGGRSVPIPPDGRNQYMPHMY